jgi:hypothetical protein
LRIYKEQEMSDAIHTVLETLNREKAELRAEVEQLREALTWWQSGKSAAEAADFLDELADFYDDPERIGEPKAGRRCRAMAKKLRGSLVGGFK